MERFFDDTLGWLNLNNTARAIEVRGTRIELFGTNDAHRNWDRLDLLPGAIEALRENVGWSDDTRHEVLSIGVTHAPYRRVLNDFVNQGADIVFAGHTHGGQVRVPGLPALVTNCDIPADQAQTLVGQRAAYDLVAGSLVAPESVTPAALPATQRAVVGMKLAGGRAPADFLVPGAPVRLVALPPVDAQPGARDPYAGKTFVARTVSSVPGPDAGSLFVDVDVPAAQAPTIAMLAAQERLSVVRDAGR
jgi:hypothetical protein